LPGSAARKNKAKQSQFTRSAFCVVRIAKRNLKKQSQFRQFALPPEAKGTLCSSNIQG
jgi:hypothetical protein